ncbi:MAG: SGNH/GDSL hydrolase family protein [Lachnospiraceae bacterium]|nr:SGNH/GDSL hydrolase family protein [Lachnospiraceae bacterium]
MKNTGTPDNIINVMNRAVEGEQITIGFIGGSITQGAVVSDEALCYAARVFKWWKDSFPEAEVRYVNAGIGATTSQFGVARVSDDLLKYDPDFVIVEYSVNDNDENDKSNDRSELFRETYESLIRRILSHRNRSGNAPAILIVNSVKYDNGRNFEEVHTEIGRHYGIPCISMKECIYDKFMTAPDGNMILPDGQKISIKDITGDMLHPNDLGHGIVAGHITDYLNALKARSDNTGFEEDGKCIEVAELPPALTFNMYEDVRRYNRLNSTPVLNGFTEDDAPVMDPFGINTGFDVEDSKKTGDDIVLSSEVRDVFRNGWHASKEGDSITFKFTGSELALMYRKSVNKPAPMAYAVIDDDEENRIRLDANFDEDWGDKAYMATLMYHGRICRNGSFPEQSVCGGYLRIACENTGQHTLTVTIEKADDCTSDFYLINVVG